MKLISLTRQENLGIAEIEFEGKTIVINFPIYHIGSRDFPIEENIWKVQSKLSSEVQEQVDKESILISAKNAIAKYFVTNLFKEIESLNNLKK